ncbi:Proteasome subunit alpha type-5 [Hibiscus syriacus]|uniref:Proteasome subunit alpha type-5 n=1 Tax=Hibiscus syriacus TaxID=106335 RepID=A0A6A2Y9Z1_HIBSY|nr:Proteasome subunit alpha type-5 [Hibiscus syriacus]
MNVLSKMLDLTASKCVFQYHPKCKRIGLTHLSFADDLLIFWKGTVNSVVGIHCVLQEFYKYSGLLPVRYLKAPLVNRRLTERDCAQLMKKVEGRALVLPKVVIKRLAQLCSRFFWKGGDLKACGARVSWEMICKPKNEGADVHVLKGNPFVEFVPPKTCSWFWRKLLKLRSLAGSLVDSTTGGWRLQGRFFVKNAWQEIRRKQPKVHWARTEYDRGVNTFSPEGRLFQVEYAIEAIKLGSTAIGIKTKDGVVLAVEKRITSPPHRYWTLFQEPSSVEKIMEIDDHIGCAMSGLIADARTLVEHARVETQNHRFSYGEPMAVESTTQALCDLALRFGEGDEESMSRPFGVSLLIAGHDENGPSLYYTDPSGTFWQCNAKAIGSGSEGADSSLQEQFNKDLTLQEAETIALSILKQVMEEKVTPNNVDIANVAPTYHLYTPSEVEAIITRL